MRESQDDYCPDCGAHTKDTPCFVSQQQNSAALAFRVGSIDELVAESLSDVLWGFDTLLAKHAAFDAYLAERGLS